MAAHDVDDMWVFSNEEIITTQVEGITNLGEGLSRGQPTPTNNPLDNQLYVGGLWDKTPIKMSLNLSDTGEAFYQAFHQWAVDQKKCG